MVDYLLCCLDFWVGNLNVYGILFSFDLNMRNYLMLELAFRLKLCNKLYLSLFWIRRLGWWLVGVDSLTSARQIEKTYVEVRDLVESRS